MKRLSAEKLMVKLKNYVSGLWKNITPICGRHDNEVTMNIVQDKGNTFCYECPECKKNNQKHTLPMNEFEKSLNVLEKKIYEEEQLSGSTIDLTSYGWTKNGIRYDIKLFSKDRIVLKVNNRTQEGRA